MRRPFGPSIDRIDPSGGYTLDNTRVVCTAVNLAMNQWGEDVLFRIARGLAMNRAKWRAAGNRWKDYPDQLPKGVKIAYMTHTGPRFSASRVVNGQRLYTPAFATVDEAIKALRSMEIPGLSLDSRSEK